MNEPARAELRLGGIVLTAHEDPEILRLFLGEARTQTRVEHDYVL